jgi:hypothetical protein
MSVDNIKLRQPKAGDLIFALNEFRTVKTAAPALIALAVVAIVMPLVLALIGVGITAYVYALFARLQHE